MTTGTKILIGTSLIIGIASLFAFRKKISKQWGKIFIPDSSGVTDIGDMLRKGSKDEQHVDQLQNILNEIHAAAKYINSKCGITWGVFPGDALRPDGVFDDKTERMLQFYLNRKEIDLEYLNEIRSKLAAYQKGDKCKYPLSY